MLYSLQSDAAVDPVSKVVEPVGKAVYESVVVPRVSVVSLYIPTAHSVHGPPASP